ncbi:major facilitator superfamily domain-containing protein [Trichoderma afarasin]
MSLIRDSAIGILIRTFSNHKLLKYPEEQEGFVLPAQYSSRGHQSAVSVLPSSSRGTKVNLEGTSEPSSGSEDSNKKTVFVTWYSDQDPENPQNWSNGRKIWVSTLLFIYTVAAYMGASIYTASEDGIMKKFGVSQTVASLGLTLYVLGYGIAPMILSPLTEIPAIGRNPPYAITFCLFTILTIPAALVDNIAGLLVIRFLLGVFCSPALSTVGASYGDFISPPKMQYVIALWSVGASSAPVMGPVVAGYAVEKMGWRWSAWELLWLSAPMTVLLLLTLPETSSDTILLRRATRLRSITRCDNLKHESETRHSHLSPREVAYQALIKPWQINALDPAVLFTTVYLALGYAIYYSFFESFPLVYRDIYGFSLGAMGLAFLSMMVGLFITSVFLGCYIYFIADKRFAKMGDVPPEARLLPGIFGSICIPVGLFMFAWTSKRSIHWIVSMCSVGICHSGVFLIGQAILGYLPFTYPRYAGSLFAANGLARSLFAGSAVLFSPPMFEKLGVAGGVSLLGGLSALCIIGMVCLYLFGANLRKKSKFAGS